MNGHAFLGQKEGHLSMSEILDLAALTHPYQPDPWKLIFMYKKT